MLSVKNKLFLALISCCAGSISIFASMQHADEGEMVPVVSLSQSAKELSKKSINIPTYDRCVTSFLNGAPLIKNSGNTAHDIAHFMTQFTKIENPTIPEHNKDLLAEKIATLMEKNAPLNFFGICMSFKNLNKDLVPSNDPDLAEALSLELLNHMAKEIKSIYPKGATFTLCSDGMLYPALFGIKQELVDSYASHMKKLCASINKEALFFDNTFATLAQPIIEQRMNHLLNQGHNQGFLMSTIQEISEKPKKDALPSFYTYMNEPSSILQKAQALEIMVKKYPKVSFAILNKDLKEQAEKYIQEFATNLEDAHEKIPFYKDFNKKDFDYIYATMNKDSTPLNKKSSLYSLMNVYKSKKESISSIINLITHFQYIADKQHTLDVNQSFLIKNYIKFSIQKTEKCEEKIPIHMLFNHSTKSAPHTVGLVEKDNSIFCTSLEGKHQESDYEPVDIALNQGSSVKAFIKK